MQIFYFLENFFYNVFFLVVVFHVLTILVIDGYQAITQFEFT